ncbi:MAG: DUF4175 family protein [Acidocella sp.]|nr:DUF4175 family protein [Acidocella sp.]
MPSPADIKLITKLRRRAARVLWAEYALQLSLPALLVLSLYLIAALCGLASPRLLAAATLAMLGSTAFSFTRLARPTPASIERRIEAASGLGHQPFAMLSDAPETADALSVSLWAAHQRRVAASLRQARTGGVRLHTARRDPYALRVFIPLLLLISFISAGKDATSRLAAGFSLPGWSTGAPLITAWLTPPPYASAAPQTINPGSSASVLAGSRFTLILNGTSTAPPAWLNGQSLGFTQLTASSFRTEVTLSAASAITLGPWWHRQADWQINLQQPAAPVISLTAPPSITNGHLVLAWRTTDPYGLSNLDARLLPASNKPILPQVITLPTALGAGLAQADISASPFAGQMVTLWLTARNRAGVTARSEAIAIMLPPGNGQSNALAAAQAITQSLDQTAQGSKLNKAQYQAFLDAVQAGGRIGTLGKGLACRTGRNLEASSNGSMMAEEAGAGAVPDKTTDASLAEAASALDALTQAQAAVLDATNHASATALQQGQVLQNLQSLQKTTARAGLNLPGLSNAASAMSAAAAALQAKFNDNAATAEMTAIQGLQIATAALAAQRQDHLAIGQGSAPDTGLSPSGIGSDGLPGVIDTALNAPSPTNAASVQEQIITQDSNAAAPASAHKYFGQLLQDQ